jgi:hypothetical protein
MVIKGVLLKILLKKIITVMCLMKALDLKGFNSEVEEIGLVDFLGVDNILSNSLDNGGFDQLYVINDQNIMFKTNKIVDPS